MIGPSAEAYIHSSVCMLRKKLLTLLAPVPSGNGDSITEFKKTRRGEIDEFVWSMLNAQSLGKIKVNVLRSPLEL